MTTQQFMGMIYNSNQVIPELLAQKDNSASLKPGLCWLALGHLALLGLLMAVAWLTIGEFAPLSQLADRIAAMIGMGLAFYAAAYVADHMMESICGSETGKQVQVFNLFIQSVVPFLLLIAVPVIGWLLIIPLAFRNKIRLLRHAYGESDLGQRVVVLALAWAVFIVVALTAGLPLRMVAAQIGRHDPFARTSHLEAALKQFEKLDIQVPLGSPESLD